MPRSMSVLEGRRTPTTKLTIAFAAALFAAISSAALAEDFDPNLANRYQGLVRPFTYGYSASGELEYLQPPATELQPAPVRAHQHR